MGPEGKADAKGDERRNKVLMETRENKVLMETRVTPRYCWSRGAVRR